MYEVFFINYGGSSEDKGHVESACETYEPLIVGGSITTKGEYPHMAAIGWKYNGFSSFQCGGSLISERFVLTAAHCSTDVRGRPPNFVRLGDHNLKLREPEMKEIDVDIAKFIPHENFNYNSYYYDIALIKLDRNVIFNNVTRPACLWQPSSDFGSEVIASGWGNTRETGFSTSNDLRKAKLDIVVNWKCNKLLNLSKLRNGVLSTQMCAGILAGRIGTCNGGKMDVEFYF